MNAAPSNACVIGGRYLASAAVVRAHPLGPVEALDTQSGRAAQVRIVFVPGSWQEEELAEAVSRWCGLGCAEVCGVLDFGRHDDRWYLTVPPSLGMSLERWRAVRQPSAADAARLALGFGRLVERIASSGFRADSADLRDLAVGPGPTPFLERPLLGAPGDTPPTPQEGEHVLGAVLSTIAPPELPSDLAAWRDNAMAGGFATLTECLDELERCAGAATGREQEQDGLEGLFDDEDLSALLPGHGEGRGRRRLLAGLGLLALVAVALVLAAPRLGSAAPSSPTLPPATALSGSTPMPKPVKHLRAAKPKHHPRHRARRPAHHPHRRPHHHRRPTAPATAPTTPPPTAPTPSAGASPSPSSGAGAPVLPAPGGVTTLPAPG